MTDNVQSAYKVHHFLVLYPYLLSQRFLFGSWLELEQKAGVDSEGDAGLCAVVFIYFFFFICLFLYRCTNQTYSLVSLCYPVNIHLAQHSWIL